MIVFFLFSLTIASEYGFNSILLKADEINVIDATNKKIIIFLPKLRPNDLTISMNSTFPITASNFIEDYFQVTDANITLKLNVDKEVLINYWLIPQNLCPLNTFVYDVEHIMKMEAEIYPKEEQATSDLEDANTICIFSQITYDVMKTNILFPNHTITFYDIYMAKEMCNSPLSCTYSSQAPFFIQVNTKVTKNRQLSFSSSVMNIKSDDFVQPNKYFHCHFKPIAYWAGVAGIPSVFPGMINSLRCINSNEEFLPFAQTCLLTSLLSTVVVLILFIWKVTCKRDPQKRNPNPPDTEYLIQDGVDYE